MTSRTGESLGLRDFLALPLLAALALVVGSIIVQERAGVVIPQATFGALWYASVAAWVLYRAPRAPYFVAVDSLSRPPAPSEWKLLWLIAPLVAVAAGGLHLLTVVASYVAPSLAESLLVPDPEPLTRWTVAGDLVETAIGAISEEWLFRGVLLHLWARRFGMRAAVAATSALFGLVHADVLGSVVFGVAMAALYVRTGTLLVPIGVHLLFNVLVTLISLVADEEITTIAEARETWWQGTAAFVVGLAVVVAALRRLTPGPWRLPGREGL